jgi:MoxR-like ATPase
MADSEVKDWRYFYGDGKRRNILWWQIYLLKLAVESQSHSLMKYISSQLRCFQPVSIENLPDPPPWRQFGKFKNNLNPTEESEAQNESEQRWWEIQDLAYKEKNERGRQKGESFRIPVERQEDGTEVPTPEAKEVLDAVNAALYLRRPLLVTGKPGSGKTSLAYAIAWELQLGPVLSWPITARSTLRAGLYEYDAIARLRDAEQPGENKDIGKDIGKYITLGPVGTAFLPSKLPRVLLIDEIDKSDINLPNDLLHLLEEGMFEIPELARRAKGEKSKAGEDEKAEEDEGDGVLVRTKDPGVKAAIHRGQVHCCAFPIVVMTSNRERDFPPAFLRRCLRVEMPDPETEALKNIIKAHFGEDAFQSAQTTINELIAEFLKEEDRATDQLLNTVYLLTQKDQGNLDRAALKELLFKRLTYEL